MGNDRALSVSSFDPHHLPLSFASRYIPVTSPLATICPHLGNAQPATAGTIATVLRTNTRPEPFHIPVPLPSPPPASRSCSPNPCLVIRSSTPSAPSAPDAMRSPVRPRSASPPAHPDPPRCSPAAHSTPGAESSL